MANETRIYEINESKWTSATQVAQAQTEALQTARGVQQVAYDAAQGNNGAERDSATLASIEAEVAARGVHTAPVVPETTTTTTTV